MSALALVRDELRTLRGYSSARLESALRDGAVLLNANESPLPPRTDGGSGLHRYPEPQRGRDAVLVSPPTFGMYAVCAEVQGAAIVRVPLAGDAFEWRADAVLAAVDGGVRLVHVCSPNNPTGGIAPRAAVLELARAVQGRALVVVDEAYVEFAGVASLAPEAARGELAVLRTLSKAHALAAARIGALVAEPALVALLQRIMAPYPLPGPSVAAAEAALEPGALADTAKRIASAIAERERIAARLPSIPGVEHVLPSRANFLAVRFVDAVAVLRHLAARGIVVRDISAQPGLAGYLRISIGTPAENDAVLAALETREAAR
jgi:histidinol-phosphate aminotransferase